jgi:hypothetical protein
LAKAKIKMCEQDDRVYHAVAFLDDQNKVEWYIQATVSVNDEKGRNYSQVFGAWSEER